MAQKHDACVAIAGYDKNMPAVVMAFARHNRSSVMVYGGTIQPGHSGLLGKTINVSECFKALGAQAYENPIERNTNTTYTHDEILGDLERHACPGPGACGCMYTANTMAAAIETMGLSLPGSSSTPATSPMNLRECGKVAAAIKTCLEKNIRPRDLITRTSLENAIVITMVVGGSTNAVIHLLAIASTADVELTVDDFQTISDKTPFLASIAPNGPYHMSDLFEIGGIPSIQRYLIEVGLLKGNTMTVNGKELAENVKSAPIIDFTSGRQSIVRPLSNPLKSSGYIQILKGNLAPGGAVAKISGREATKFTGRALIFNKEHELNTALEQATIPRDYNYVIFVRYEGPKGGPGMPEQLKASGAIIGANLTNIALITDGRYSGASHGFIVGHIVPEAAAGGPIALIQDNDIITIDADTNQITVHISDEELKERRKNWRPPKPSVTRGTLAKYAHCVGDASSGCVTDLF